LKANTEEANLKKVEIIGEAYRELQEIVKRYAKENLPVLFTGETGTGKELFMDLYKESCTKTGKKMTINCAAYSDELLRSEVFGHVEGAFTDAIENRKGKIAACYKGVLALDEIGDATQEFQAAILRVTNGDSYFPVGADEEKKTDTVIIAATNRPEKLRSDLIERFHVLPIPPLQKEDIPALARHFLGKQISEKVIAELQGKSYKGNIRGLEKACERLKAEKYNDSFDKRKQFTDVPYRFDYNRYRREIDTWNSYIQPLIDHYGREHGFDKYKYKYQPWDGDPLKWIKEREPHLDTDSAAASKVMDMDVDFEESDKIEEIWLLYYYIGAIRSNIGLEDNLPTDKSEIIHGGDISYALECLNKFLNSKKLPCLLGYIYLDKERSSIRSSATTPQPNLLYLLDLPLKQAEKEFLQHYYDYNTKSYPDKDKLQSVTGMTQRTLDQRIRRYKNPPKPPIASK
jgi:DNA polymerase III delta prime subunit